MKGKSFLKNLKFIKIPHIIYHASWKEVMKMKKILNKKGYIIAPIIIATFIAGFILGLFIGRYMPIGWLFPCNYAGDIFLDFITSIIYNA